MKKPLDQELAKTLRAVHGLHAKRQDDLEDYFHDAVTRVLSQGKSLEHWLGYLYKSVSRRIAVGREGKDYLPLDENLIPNDKPHNLDLSIDIRNALKELTPTQQTYIYLYFYEEYTFEEIAHLRDVTKQAVEQTIQRGLDKMKRVLRRR